MDLSGPVYDCVGVGFGPSNIALSIYFQEINFQNVIFLEKESDSIWQKNMLLDEANIQHSPFNDLVTLRNPCSKYSFINYLRCKDRLIEYYDLGLEYPLRLEYSDYVNWVAKQLKNCMYNETVIKIDVSKKDRSFIIKTKDNKIFMSKAIVIGTGRTPHIPVKFQKMPKDKCFHLSNYLPSIEKLDKDDSFNFAVIGSGQSSVEIILDILKKFPNSNVNSYIRNFSFKLKDTNPFIEKAILPKYTKDFYNLSYKNKKLYREDLKYINYSSADMDVLKKLNLHIYESLLKDKSSRFKCINNSNITNAIVRSKKIQITSHEKYTMKKKMESYDFVILATGFKNIGKDKHNECIPPILLNISDLYMQNEHKFCHVNLDYSLQPKDKSSPVVYLNGLCETTHGMGDAGTFSLVSIRAKAIGDSISSAISN